MRNKLIKYISFIMSMILFISVIPINAFDKDAFAYVTESNENSEISMGKAWDGVTIQEPTLYGYEYKIDTAEKLAWFATEVNNKNDFSGKSIYITGNINLNNKTWLVIGNSTSKNFTDIKGNIIINDAIISGLSTAGGNQACKGLFGAVRVWNLSIDNLTIKDANIASTNTRDYDGILFGSLEVARNGICDIRNTKVNGDILGYSECGAFAGYISGANTNTTIKITNCDFDLVSNEISHSLFFNSSGSCRGGMIGVYNVEAEKNTLILNGVNCNVDIVALNGSEYAETYAGGMIGKLLGKSNIYISQCSVSGKIESNAYFGYAGGIIGYIGGCNIYKQENSMVTAEINSYWNTTGYAYNAGGFFDGEPDKGYIKNSYFAGKSDTTVAFVGQSGYCEEFKIYNSYYDYQKSINRVFHTMWVSGLEVSGTTVDCKGYNTSEMGVQSNFVGWDFDKVWKMGDTYPELRQTNFDLPKDFIEDSNCNIKDSEIVRIVREYASEEYYAQWEAIWNSNYSDEVKIEKILALSSNYGITDPKEGIEFVSKSTNKRRAYRILTTDEIYMASNFKNWLKEGINFEKLLLGIDGLAFNREINEWLDVSTYIEEDYPGVVKYKDMLYDYLDISTKKIDAMEDVNLVCGLAKNVTEANQLWVSEKLKKLNDSYDSSERREIIDELEQKGVFLDANNENESGKYNFVLDETSGFGKFASAMGKATKTLTIVSQGIDDIRDIMQLDSKLQAYYEFKPFLNDIINDKSKFPFELRVAAEQVLEELDNGYWTNIKDIAGQFMSEFQISKKVKEYILQKFGATSVLSFINMINIDAWFINKIADIGNIVKKEAYVEGYAYIADIYKKRLNESREAFLNNMTDENAWEFYYNYNMLYSIRQEGEKAYLKMCDIKGVIGKLLSFGYAAKEEAVNETLAILNDSCQFDLGEVTDIPESLQYLSKLVTSCPVNVIVYKENGDVITELKDGKLSDESNEYGRFAVVYNYYTCEYEKVVCLLNKNVKIKIEAIDDGLVSIDYAYINNGTETSELSLSNVALNKNNVINIVPSIIEESRKIKMIDGNAANDLIMNEKNNSYIKLTDASLSKKSIRLSVGESKLLNINVNPENATIQDVSWYSSNPDVATVKNGNIKAVGNGRATIYCFMSDKNTPLTCEVNVSEIEFGDANDDGIVNTQDAVLIKKYLAEYDNVDINLEASDVNGDGEVTSADAVLLLKYLAEYDVTLGR